MNTFLRDEKPLLLAAVVAAAAFPLEHGILAAGQAAAKAVAEILPPGKCKIAKLPMKDANECLAQL